MRVELSLFGFGGDRPTAFGNSDQLQLTLEKKTTISHALEIAGFDEIGSLSTMLNNTLVTPHDRSTRELFDGDALTILMAIEGG